ncbi:MAG: capsule biosynthesis protein [Hyphomicrobiaceae bacterium]
MARPHPDSTILITTLAAYQTRFWLPVAKLLIAHGRAVELLAFDDRSFEMAQAAGVPANNIFRDGLAGLDADSDIDAMFRRRIDDYGIDNVNLLLSHERVTFAIRDTGALARRFVIYSNALEGVLDRLQTAGKSAVMVQELGGFLSVIASFHAARRRGIDNWFLEPSFFRGRMFFVANTFKALQAMDRPAEAVSGEVARYLEQTYRSQAIVVPIKDRHQYAPAVTKVANFRNVRRLGEKLYDQYVLGKHQEFGHNLHHARSHALMVRNAVSMQRHYQGLPEGKPFIYYPLHVPADMALTLRSPEYLDQLALIDYILRVIPASHMLAIKEHPAQIGAIPAARLKQLIRRYDNLVVLAPKSNNFSILERADAVVSVNSKSGAEALLLGKQVVVLGDAFYGKCPLVLRANRLHDLGDRIREALARPDVDRNEAAKYFQTAWDRSAPGELYVADEGLIGTFVQSLETVLSGGTTEEMPVIAGWMTRRNGA